MKIFNLKFISIITIIILIAGIFLFFSKSQYKELFQISSNEPMTEEILIRLSVNKQKLEPYVSVLNEYQMSFDAKTAAKDGYNEEDIQLMKETIEFQNILLKPTASSSANFDYDKSLEKFPLLKKYLDAATVYNNKRNQ